MALFWTAQLWRDLSFCQNFRFMVQPWQLEQSEESEQDLMDKFGLRTGSKRKGCTAEGRNVTAACWFTTAAINGSYIISLNQIGAISLKKFPICHCSWDGWGWRGSKRKKGREQERANLEKADKIARENNSERLNLRKRSARVTARPQDTGRLVCLATISQSQERLRWYFRELLVLSH